MTYSLFKKFWLPELIMLVVLGQTIKIDQHLSFFLKYPLNYLVLDIESES